MVAVAYRRWSFTRGSNCESLTGKAFVFWIGVAYGRWSLRERWSHIEVRLHFAFRRIDINISSIVKSLTEIHLNSAIANSRFITC